MSAQTPPRPPPQPPPNASGELKISRITPGSRLIGFVIGLLVLLVALAWLYEAGYLVKPPEGEEKPEFISKLLNIGAIVLATWLVYLIPSRALDVHAEARPDRKGDIIMIKGLIRSLMLIIALFAIISVIFRVGAILALLATFGGMFLGWSLQSPVSGFVAWIVVTVKRPFRIGDRIFFPSWGLIGDVLDVGIMYTRMNQVGGTVGSEEKSNREILIPNAILWGNVIINYTSQLTTGDETTERFILDEVIVRITFDSDWDEAEKIMLRAAREVTYDIIEDSGTQPYIRSDLYDYGIYLRLRYMTLAVDRPRIVHEITKRVVRYIQESKKVDLAIPYVYSYRHGVR